MIRTGKLTGHTKVLIPYYDADEKRQFQIITITSPIYASKLYAGIRKFVKDNYGIDVDKDWLHNVPLIMNSNDPELKISDEEKQKLIDEFINRMELKDDDETQDDTVSGSESEAAVEAGEPLRPVSDQPIEG